MIKQLTVRKLMTLCQQEVVSGNGDRKVLISDDNEGNGFHGLFYGFSKVENGDYEGMLYDTEETDKDKIIILG